VLAATATTSSEYVRPSGRSLTYVGKANAFGHSRVKPNRPKDCHHQGVTRMYDAEVTYVSC